MTTDASGRDNGPSAIVDPNLYVPVAHQPTLRDQFAMAVLPAIVMDNNEPYTIDSHVKKAYRYADAMLKFRSSNDGAMASRYGKKKK